MLAGSSLKASLTILTSLAIFWSAFVGYAFLAPLTLAFFLVAMVWPVQSAMQRFVPKTIAVIVTFLILVLTIVVLSTIVLWALDSIWRTLAGNVKRYQELYQAMANWLEEHGIVLAALWAETFNVNWMLRIGQQLLARTGQTMTFWAVVIAYVLTLLVEIRHIGLGVERYTNPDISRIIQAGTAETARKLRLYMGVRAVVSLATGVMISLIAIALALPLAVEWGVIGFVLNFIPVIGPLVATLLPTAFAFAHIGDPWSAVLLFGGLTVLQFVGGSYIEPKIAGDALRLSPFIVLVAVFLWTFIWGIYGTFIGVPIAIAVACFAAHSPSSQWVLGILSGTAPSRKDTVP
jgi:AI-2 transport protein TqsA